MSEHGFDLSWLYHDILLYSFKQEEEGGFFLKIVLSCSNSHFKNTALKPASLWVAFHRNAAIVWSHAVFSDRKTIIWTAYYHDTSYAASKIEFFEYSSGCHSAIQYLVIDLESRYKISTLNDELVSPGLTNLKRQFLLRWCNILFFHLVMWRGLTHYCWQWWSRATCKSWKISSATTSTAATPLEKFVERRGAAATTSSSVDMCNTLNESLSVSFKPSEWKDDFHINSRRRCRHARCPGLPGMSSRWVTTRRWSPPQLNTPQLSKTSIRRTPPS